MAYAGPYDEAWLALCAIDFDWGARHIAPVSEPAEPRADSEQDAGAEPAAEPITLPEPTYGPAEQLAEPDPRQALPFAFYGQEEPGAVPFVFAAPAPEDTRPAWKRAWHRAKGPIATVGGIILLIAINQLLNSGVLPF